MSPQYTGGRWPLLAIAGVLMLALLGACQPITEEKATLPWLDEHGGEAEVSAANLDELTETEAALATRAIEVLAATLDVDPASITLVSVEPVDWPDASLGCPEPDMMYAAMITPGYRITLSVNDEKVDYHTTTSADSQLVTCEKTQ